MLTKSLTTTRKCIQFAVIKDSNEKSDSRKRAGAALNEVDETKQTKIK